LPDGRTYVGQFAKKFYLDELPQFYSVLKVDMSIVGEKGTEKGSVPFLCDLTKSNDSVKLQLSY